MTAALEGGEWSAALPGRILPPGKTRYPFYRRLGGQIEVTRRRGRRSKKLLDDLKDRRGYCQLKEEAVDRTM